MDRGEKTFMSIWLAIALVSYFLGVVMQCLQLIQEIQQCDEDTNFPIVWTMTAVKILGYFLGALIWPYNLVLGKG